MNSIASVTLEIKSYFSSEMYINHRSPYRIRTKLRSKELRSISHLLDIEISFASFNDDINNLLTITLHEVFQSNDLYINWQNGVISSYGFVSNESKYNLVGTVSKSKLVELLEELRTILVMADKYLGSVADHEKSSRLALNSSL